MSVRTNVVLVTGGLALVAAVGLHEHSASATSGEWSQARQWSALAPWYPVANIASPPVPLDEQLAIADQVGIGSGQQLAASIASTASTAPDPAAAPAPTSVTDLPVQAAEAGAENAPSGRAPVADPSTGPVAPSTQDTAPVVPPGSGASQEVVEP